MGGPRLATTRGPYNLVVAGVGGQGNVVMSEVVAMGAALAGLRVVVGETYGASQRGGSVMSHIRVFRSGDYGPLIPLRQAHAILGLEPLEALRVSAQYAGPDTVAVVNLHQSYPVGVLAGEDTYPATQDILSALRARSARLLVLDATELAGQAGDSRAMNMVMTGCLAGLGVLPVQETHYRRAIEGLWSGRSLEVNLRALELGLARVQRDGVSGVAPAGLPDRR